MGEDKKPAPEGEAQAREVWRIGDTEVEFSREGLIFRVLRTIRQDSEQAHNLRG